MQVGDQRLHYLFQTRIVAVFKGLQHILGQGPFDLNLLRGNLSGLCGVWGGHAFLYGISSRVDQVSDGVDGAGVVPFSAAVSSAVMSPSVTVTGFEAGTALSTRCVASGMSAAVNP